VSSGHAPVLVTRVMEALHAFGDDCVVVAVAVPDRPGPATFSVRLPGRALHRTGLHRLTPCARLELDLLVPSADADRQVLIRLPDGIGLTGDAAGRSPAARVEVRTGVPRALQRFLELWWQVPAGGPATLTGAGRCLAELALAQADLAQDVFRCHEPVDGPAVQEAFDRTQARLRLRRPGEEPGEFPVGTGRAGGAPADRTGTGTSGVDDPGADGAVLSGLLQAEGPLLRVAQVEAVGPRSVLVRLDAVEDAVLRGGVQSARVTLDVVAEDPAILRTARAASSGGLVVLGATVVVLTAFSATRPDPRVLATMLALFAAVQFSRLERPDRSTLRGLLTSVSAWIGVAGVLPSLLLGVATAFLSEDAGSGTEPRVLGLTVRQLCWGALLLQVVVQMLLTGPLAHRSTGRSALHRAGPPAPRMRLRTEPAPDHRRVSVLQGTWWRDMTGAALLLGRPSHACLVLPEGGALPQLLGTGRRPREVPCQEWIPGSRAQGFELTPDRLVPRVAPAGLVDVFLGLPGDEPTPLLHCHPVLAVLRAVADEGWEVGEVQLPVPAPPGGDPGRRWLRVRVCVDDGELRHLGDFLRGLARQAHLGRTGEDAELLVRGVPRGRPERLYPDDGGEPPSARLPHRHPVQVADLDGVSLPGPARDAPDWNVIGLCGGTRTGIESALLERAGTRREKLHLAGLTTSRLYGTTVVFLLGYRPGGRRTEDEPLQLLPRHPGDLAEVLHDSWVSATVFRLRPDQPVTDR
ncbi:MAG TPA: hypothetical protein VFP72_03735, partial [Kineosporiaceae bacterium]|nr:hypothetical protein [Kineosporiaceae bacterium]